VATPIFERDGDVFVATTLARGPWDPDACHGGAPAALLAATVDAMPSLVPMQAVRLTFELLRPVPVGVALRRTTEVIREGKRIQSVEATLTDEREGRAAMRVRALRIRTTNLDLPDDRPVPQPAPTPGTGALERFPGLPGWDAEGFWQAVDVRFVTGQLGAPGRGIAWFRVLAPIADGISLTPLARAAAAGDFGNGIGAPLSMGPFAYVNPDLTIDLHRLPEGDWVAADASSVAQANGIGLATTTLADQRGAIGTALQSLFIADTRDGTDGSA
jgi:hypothetical protein